MMNRKLLLTNAFCMILLAVCASAEQNTEQNDLDSSEYEEYLKLYNETSISSHKKLTLMHQKSNLSKLGKEKINGNISGTCEYKAKVQFLKGVVTIVYKDYCDFPGWVLNGETDTKANIHADGKMYGCVNVSGSKPGKIFYENLIIKKGTSAGGTYGVQLDKKERKEIEYTILPQEIEESIDDITEENIKNIESSQTEVQYEKETF